MTTQFASTTKCSKPAGVYCRLHNPGPDARDFAATTERISQLFEKRNEEGLTFAEANEKEQYLKAEELLAKKPLEGRVAKGFSVDTFPVKEFREGDIAYLHIARDGGNPDKKVLSVGYASPRGEVFKEGIQYRAYSFEDSADLTAQVANDVAATKKRIEDAKGVASGPDIRKLKQLNSLYRTVLRDKELRAHQANSAMIKAVYSGLHKKWAGSIDITGAAAIVETNNSVSALHPMTARAKKEEMVHQILIHKFDFDRDVTSTPVKDGYSKHDLVQKRDIMDALAEANKQAKYLRALKRRNPDL